MDRKTIKGKFVVEVKYRRNNSCQGTVFWLSEKKSASFRSTLELIKILHSAEKQYYRAIHKEDVTIQALQG